MGKKGAVAAEARNQAADSSVGGIVFDAGGLIALERNDRRIFAILAVAAEEGARIIVPATALAQVIRNPARQVRLWRMIQHDGTDVVPLDGSHAQAVGALLARAGLSDIADAHVVICAQQAGAAVISSDSGDLRRLDATLDVIDV